MPHQQYRSLFFERTEMTFKSEIYKFCEEIAVDFDEWEFTSTGLFKNKALKHTDKIVRPGFYFQSGLSCTVGPSAAINNKKTTKLFKQICGYEMPWTSSIYFQTESTAYRGASSVFAIFPEKIAIRDSRGQLEPWSERFLIKSQAKDYLRQVLVDGIRFLDKYYDFSSEENLLRNLPAGFKDRAPELEALMGHMNNYFYENIDGIFRCLAAVVLGNFDFVEHYASDDFKTTVPKREVELKKLLDALPELKRQFAQTGKVI